MRRDVACGDDFPADGKEVGFKVVPAIGIPDGWLGLDYGPDTTRIKRPWLTASDLVRPHGCVREPAVLQVTHGIAECLAETTEKDGAITTIGGGDSVSAVNKSELAPRMSHISTGGGASLELLEGKVLPGVAALDDA